AEGRTVLLTTQYLEEAEELADDIVVIDHGEVIARGTPAELKQIVGGRTVAVRTADPEQTRVAAKVLRAVSGREPDRAGDKVTVPVDDARALTEAARALEASGVEVAELALRLPGLDEVFSALTGRRDEEGKVR